MAKKPVKKTPIGIGTKKTIKSAAKKTVKTKSAAKKTVSKVGKVVKKPLTDKERELREANVQLQKGRKNLPRKSKRAACSTQ